MAYPVLLLCRHDPLKYLFQRPALVGRYVKWQVLLSQYDITFVTQKSVKGQAMADHLVDFPLPEYQPQQMQFLDEDILFTMEDSEQKDPKDEQQWQLYFNSAVNRRGRARVANPLCKEADF